MVRAVLGITVQLTVWVFVLASTLAAYDRFDRAVSLAGSIPQLRSELYGSVYSTYFFAGSLSLIGLLLSIEVAVRGRYRKRWFFWASLILVVPICTIFPVGTLLGTGFLVYLYVKRREFHTIGEGG